MHNEIRGRMMGRKSVRVHEIDWVQTWPIPSPSPLFFFYFFFFLIFSKNGFTFCGSSLASILCARFFLVLVKRERGRDMSARCSVLFTSGIMLTKRSTTSVCTRLLIVLKPTANDTKLIFIFIEQFLNNSLSSTYFFEILIQWVYCLFLFLK
jgi:hypothetical protein